MSQRPPSPEPFQPFDPVAGAVPSPPPSPSLKVVSRQDTSPPFKPMEMRSGPASAHDSSGKPIVTLQRDGDRITGIRVECVCGQVIELACFDSANPVAP